MDQGSLFGLNAFGIPGAEKEDPHKDDPIWDRNFVVSGAQLRQLPVDCPFCKQRMHKEPKLIGAVIAIRFRYYPYPHPEY